MLTFTTRSDIVRLPGRTEDGEEAYGDVFYVVAEAADGRRWAHGSFTKHGMVEYEEGCFPGVINHNAEAQAEALAKLFENGRRVVDADWHEIDPCYGSEAYRSLDAVGYWGGRERAEARDAGELVPGCTIGDLAYETIGSLAGTIEGA